MCVLPRPLDPPLSPDVLSTRRKKPSPSAGRRRSSSSTTALSGRSIVRRSSVVRRRLCRTDLLPSPSQTSTVRSLVPIFRRVHLLTSLPHAAEWIQKGWDTPTPEIGKLWLRRHRILDSRASSSRFLLSPPVHQPTRPLPHSLHGQVPLEGGRCRQAGPGDDCCKGRGRRHQQGARASPQGVEEGEGQDDARDVQGREWMELRAEPHRPLGASLAFPPPSSPCLEVMH